ncbi:alpha/beta fold hydrolase [Gordonia terrae]|uniref:alpha/beta fold hydrolase n=1 Tax=Gordonia terrae TaxID=2055 RepID=UPI003F6CDAC0
MITATPVLERVHVEAHPSGREVRGEHDAVLLHGIGGAASSCAPLAARLAAAGLNCWCPDAPGYGRSHDPRAGVDPVDEIADVVRALSPDRPVVLLGTSWGGVIAMALAIRHPGLVSALVVADSTRGSGTSAHRAAAMRSRVTGLADRGPAAVAAERAGALTAPGADPSITAEVQRTMSAVRLPGFGVAAEFMAATDLGADLASITAPTLVVVGEHDTITGVDESRLLAERIPGAVLRIVPDAGHVAIQERPGTVADHVMDFLGSLP